MMFIANEIILRMTGKDRHGAEHVVEHSMDPDFKYYDVWTAAYGSENSTQEEVVRIRSGLPAIHHMSNVGLWSEAHRLIESTNRLKAMCESESQP